MADPHGGTARWRVLIVDDCADDAELATIELRMAGIRAECRRAEHEAALRTALDGDFDPDLVLLDLNLPGFSGAAALELVRAHAPAARIVLVTGGLREDESPPEADAVLLKQDLHALPALALRLLGK
jgi:DNA-binding response OmpR family regulator